MLHHISLERRVRDADRTAALGDGYTLFQQAIAGPNDKRCRATVRRGVAGYFIVKRVGRLPGNRRRGNPGYAAHVAGNVNVRVNSNCDYRLFVIDFE